MTNDLEKNQAKIYKRTDIGKSHFFVAIPDQHWTRGMDRMKKDVVASHYVPTHTHFTKLPHWNKKAGKEEIIEALREQLEYWQLQMAGKQANQLNYETGSREELDQEGNAESYYRYQKRAEAVCHFLDVLQENPRMSDVNIYHTHYKEVSYPEWLSEE